MRTSRRMRAAGAWGHLLLVAVLALGVFAMHTLGHPTGHADASRAPMGTAAHAAATRAHPTPDHGMATMAGPAASPEHATAHHGDTSRSHPPGKGMDMTSLCLAVLGSWALAGLLCLALRRRADRPVPLRAGTLAALRPNPRRALRTSPTCRYCGSRACPMGQGRQGRGVWCGASQGAGAAR
ncbi:hypothetical protein [Streptomyces noursei]|uniref:hypothetical protein n=1 Tax=Streptomyces noursei TaxID=1971 RepID=UPI0022A67E21|nr:hypothetical protein [Streptomyces noursei]MCZ1019148.1 hypothetical protein [Streptomyces noursei]